MRSRSRRFGVNQFAVSALAPWTWDPANKAAQVTLSNGDLTAAHNGTANTFASVKSNFTFDPTDSVGFYFEVVVSSLSATPAGGIVGVGNASASVGANNYIGETADGWGYYGTSGQLVHNAVGTAYGATYSAGDVIQVWVRGGKIWFGKNGTLVAGDLVADTGAAFTGLTGALYAMATVYQSVEVFDAHFKAGSFTYPTRGFKPVDPSGAAVDPLAGIPMVIRLEAWKQPQSDGSTVTTVTDFSGNGNDLTGTNVTYKASAITAGLGGYRFNGTSSIAVSASIPAMNNVGTRWYYVVFNKLSVPATVGLVFVGENSDSPAGTGDLAYIGNPGVANNSVIRFGAGGSSPGYIDQNNYGYTPGGELALKLWSDGSQFNSKYTGVAAAGAQAQPTPIANGTYKFMLGAGPSGAPGLFLNEDVVAAFVGNTGLSAPDQATIEAYILSTYGITV